MCGKRSGTAYTPAKSSINANARLSDVQDRIAELTCALDESDSKLSGYQQDKAKHENKQFTQNKKNNAVQKRNRANDRVMGRICYGARMMAQYPSDIPVSPVSSKILPTLGHIDSRCSKRDKMSRV